MLMDILPKAPFRLVCSSRESELIKYARNSQGYVRVVFANLLYDLAEALGADWTHIKRGLEADPLHGNYATEPVRHIGRQGRGAGGPCWIKDFAALRESYEKEVGDSEGLDLLRAFEVKNKQLLKDSGKDLNFLEEVYGK